MLIVVGGLLYWGLAVGLIAALAVPQAPGQSTTTTTSTPQPTPSVTPIPNVAAPVYIAAIMPRVESLAAAFDQAGTDCSAGDITACRSDMQTMHDEVVSFQTVLDQHPAPPCLKQVDALLRQALADDHDAAELAVRGIDTGGSEEIQAAGVLLTLGATHLSDAAAALKQASC